MHRVTPVIGNAFVPVEKALWETFVLALFEGLGEVTPNRGVTRLPLKQAVLVLPDPTLTAPENWTASYVITWHLVAALRGKVEFRTADHSACIWEGWTAVWRQSQQWAEEALAAKIAGGPVQGARPLQQATKTGAWLMVHRSTVNGMELVAHEWRDFLFLWYGLENPRPSQIL